MVRTSSRLSLLDGVPGEAPYEEEKAMQAASKLQAFVVASALTLSTLILSGSPASVAAHSSGCTVSQGNGAAANITAVVCPDGVPIPSKYLPPELSSRVTSSHIESSSMVDPYILWDCGWGVTCFAWGHSGYGTTNYTWFFQDRYGNLTTQSGSTFCGLPGCSTLLIEDPNSVNRKVIELFAMGPAFVFTDCWCWTVFGGSCRIYN